MDIFSYYTVDRPAQGLYKEKGSKFISFVFPVESEKEVRFHLENMRKEFFDARHQCYGWMLGQQKRHFRAFDDGEPNHSAGDPILGQIRSRNLTNVLVVVVRYFGGVKLGVGGLITAYRTAADDALKNSHIVQREVKSRYHLRFDYASTPHVMKLIKEFDLAIIRQQFSTECDMDFEVPARMEEHFLEKVDLLRSLGNQLRADVS